MPHYNQERTSIQKQFFVHSGNNYFPNALCTGTVDSNAQRLAVKPNSKAKFFLSLHHLHTCFEVQLLKFLVQGGSTRENTAYVCYVFN